MEFKLYQVICINPFEWETTQKILFNMGWKWVDTGKIMEWWSGNRNRIIVYSNNTLAMTNIPDEEMDSTFIIYVRLYLGVWWY